MQLGLRAWEKSKLPQFRVSHGSLRMLSRPLWKSITHCPNCDPCCRTLIVGAFCRGSSQGVQTGSAPWCAAVLPLFPLSLSVPTPSLPHLYLRSLLHLWAAYNSAETHSSSFAGISVLSCLALILLCILYFTSVLHFTICNAVSLKRLALFSRGRVHLVTFSAAQLLYSDLVNKWSISLNRLIGLYPISLPCHTEDWQWSCR